MADKAIYSVDTVTSMSGTDKVYVNTGDNIKQITKDDLCGNDIKGINDDLICGTKVSEQSGVYQVSNGKYTTENSYKCATNYIEVREKTPIKLALSGSSADIAITFYDSNKNYLGRTTAITGSNTSEISGIIPDNAKYCIPSWKGVDISATLYTTKIGNIVTDINSSLSDYGLNNVFDGQLLAGNYDIYNRGSFISIASNHMSSKNYILCKEGDTIKIKYGKAVTNQMHFTFFKADGTYISSAVSGQVSEFSAVAPSECSKFMFTVIDTTENHNTIGTCYPISVYVNNQIDVVNSKCSSLIVSETVEDTITYTVGNIKQIKIPDKTSLGYIPISAHIIYGGNMDANIFNLSLDPVGNRIFLGVVKVGYGSGSTNTIKIRVNYRKVV